MKYCHYNFKLHGDLKVKAESRKQLLAFSNQQGKGLFILFIGINMKKLILGCLSLLILAACSNNEKIQQEAQAYIDAYTKEYVRLCPV